MESSGYTENQVDVLIKTTDDAGMKVTDIINKLSNLGGEIKFLEGLFDFQGISFFPKKNLTISGVGNSTILSNALWNLAGCDTILKNLKLIERDLQLILLSRSNCYISNVTFGNSASFISFYNGDINSKVFISNCNSISFQNKTASNWENIWVDGVASTTEGSITKWQDGRMEIRGQTEFTKDIQIILPASFISTEYKVYCQNRYLNSFFFNAIEVQTVSAFAIFSSASTVERCMYLAIGRWK